MSAIRILPDNLINKIAAGEVVERPASVVKELIENAIDAGATEVLVDIERSGKRLIRIADNGGGMSREDARLAFERHATSKIVSEADLDAIRTMGFRGEALASIASVSRVRMLTAQRGAATGTLIEIDGGIMKPSADSPPVPGTTIEVNHLFFNTPARLKFLKSDTTELSHIIAAVSHQALARPGVRFRLDHDSKTVLDLPETSSLKERVYQVFGSDLGENLREFSGRRAPVHVYGMLGLPNYSRGDRTYQELYVNGRYVRNASMNHALYEAYRDLIMRDRHPAAFLFIEMDPALVDVNVHPAKAEVRFRNQSQLHDLVRDVIREALRGRHTPSSYHDESAPDPADRIKDTIADFGSRIADVESNQYLRHGGIAASSDISVQSAIHNPQSALLQPLAQVHDSFIVAQDNEGMALIDQHAAHERVLFEKLQDQFSAGGIPVQPLLIPIPVEPGHADGALLKEHLPQLGGLGLQVEDFGGGTFMIKAVPALMTGGDHKRLLSDILDEMKLHGASARMEQLRDDILSVMACHPAIKVHRKLSSMEMEGLIRDLFACRMPHSCPHGRPTIVRFSMDEINKMFKRI